ncbi:MAG: formate dehydrogenase subunit gamma [Tepidisphaerales bacterium]
MWHAIVLLLVAGPWARAAEPEGCLTCHQYQGLSRIDASGKYIADFFVDPDFYSRGLGPHSRLKCTDCHIRSEVEAFPHQKVTKVDCMRACHVASQGKVETRFSHQPVAQMLAGSVHKPDALKKSNGLMGSPLSEKQSQCLLCHDEPVFSGTDNWMSTDAAIQRCKTCHDQTFPMDTRFDLWHVHSRTTPSRGSADMVRICGACHSNEGVKAAFKLPDSTASYLASFHGKATLLGERNTADCLHCHAGLGQNVHTMLKSDDAKSPTSPLQSPDTCRTSGCHGSAGAQFSAAAVHFDLGSTRGIEFYIACGFVGLILLTFGPSLLLTGLKLVHHAVGKHEPEYHHHWHLAESLLAKSHTREKLIRFQAHQRMQHWLLAISFTLLCLTGFPMKFADRPWAGWMIANFGGLAAARVVHRAAGVMLITGFVYHLVYILGVIWQESRRTGKGFFKTLLAMPMSITPRDALQMNQLLLYYAFLRKTKPAAGKFGPEEKFEYVGVFWGTFVLGMTGLLLWANSWASRFLPGRVFTIAVLIHTFEAFLALLHIGIVHMTHVIFSPNVFPISTAMFTGHTPKKKLVKGHGGLLRELAAETGMAAEKEVPHV